MSGVICTRVSVTKPIPGSWTSRASSVASSARIWSATRSGREPWLIEAWRSREEFHFGPGDQAGLDPLDLVGRRRQLPIRVRLIGADGHDGEGGALPEIV